MMVLISTPLHSTLMTIFEHIWSEVRYQVLCFWSESFFLFASLGDKNLELFLDILSLLLVLHSKLPLPCLTAIMIILVIF